MADDPRAGEDPRVAELLRVNGELAAEIRDLSLGRRAEPRRGQVPAARSVARLQAERDSLAAELEASKAEVDRLTRQGEELDRRVQDQMRHIEELTHEVTLLRAGVAGILRRARARLLLHR